MQAQPWGRASGAAALAPPNHKGPNPVCIRCRCVLCWSSILSLAEVPQTTNDVGMLTVQYERPKGQERNVQYERPKGQERNMCINSLSLMRP
jgi:hypothetical protein